MKKIMIFILIFCIQNVVFANEINKDEVPRFIQFLGRFHPLILHLPIGALLITFYLDILGRVKKNYPKTTIKYALGFSSFFAVLACFLGYFLSLEGGYEGNTLDIHFWVGILSAILISLLFIMSRINIRWVKRLFFPVFILAVACISIAGHYGSVLTHGDDFITKYAGSASKLQIIEQVDSLKLYDNVIAKIMEDKCVRCHNSTKKKGELSLVSKEMILKGGGNGLIIHKNNAETSPLYTSSFLPMSDDHHMPPEGKPQLTKDELWILKYWINHNLNFTAKVSEFPKNDTLQEKLKKYLILEKIHIPAASISAIKSVKNVGFNVKRLVPNSAGLSVKLTERTPNKTTIKTLSGLKEQIFELDLSNSSLNDKMTRVLRKFKNLKKLRLENTNISDKTLENLEGLQNLEVLNLYNTGISNNGLEKLLSAITPKRIYVWNTKVSNSFANELAKKYSLNISTGVFKGFIVKAFLKKPELLTKKTLFIDTISVCLSIKMKKVEIRYTTNGDEPDAVSTLYKTPIFINTSTKIKTKAFKKGWFHSETLTSNFVKVKYEILNYTIVHEPDFRYPKSSKLFDLEEGSASFKDGKWAGFLGGDINTTIKLDKVEVVDKISVNCLESFGNYVLYPNKIIVFASMSEKTDFKKVGELKINRKGIFPESIIDRFTLNIPNTKAQFFKVIVENRKVLPKNHPAAGEPSWMFVSEIILW